MAARENGNAKSISWEKELEGPRGSLRAIYLKWQHLAIPICKYRSLRTPFPSMLLYSISKLLHYPGRVASESDHFVPN